MNIEEEGDDHFIFLIKKNTLLKDIVFAPFPCNLDYYLGQEMFFVWMGVIPWTIIQELACDWKYEFISNRLMSIPLAYDNGNYVLSIVFLLYVDGSDWMLVYLLCLELPKEESERGYSWIVMIDFELRRRL